jgi:hypothetical protein
LHTNCTLHILLEISIGLPRHSSSAKGSIVLAIASSSYQSSYDVYSLCNCFTQLLHQLLHFRHPPIFQLLHPLEINHTESQSCGFGLTLFLFNATFTQSLMPRPHVADVLQALLVSLRPKRDIAHRSTSATALNVGSTSATDLKE